MNEWKKQETFHFYNMYGYLHIYIRYEEYEAYGEA